MTEQAQAQEAQAQPQLSLADLNGAVQVIDLATARGAIRGEELSAVGALRDRFAAFLQAAVPAEEAEAEPAEGEAPAAE